MRLGEHVMLIQLQLSKGIPSTTTPQSTPTVSISKQNDSEPGPSKPNLSEASRSLTNTLKKLSTTVSKEDDLSKHMHHHGKGIYSGTFSGTLNPILQDTAGKPKKHVSTIVHILNDLLGGVDLKGSSSSSSSTSTSSGDEVSRTNSGGIKRKSTDSNLEAQPEKIPKAELNPEENVLLKSKIDKLINELKLKKKERLERHNITS